MLILLVSNSRVTPVTEDKLGTSRTSNIIIESSYSRGVSKQQQKHGVSYRRDTNKSRHTRNITDWQQHQNASNSRVLATGIQGASLKSNRRRNASNSKGVTNKKDTSNSRHTSNITYKQYSNRDASKSRSVSHRGDVSNSRYTRNLSHKQQQGCHRKKEILQQQRWRLQQLYMYGNFLMRNETATKTDFSNLVQFSISNYLLV